MTYTKTQRAPHAEPTAPTRSEDSNLVEAINSGDKRALHDAYELYAGYVNGVAIGILKDPHLAADITQEVFVRLWQRGDRFDAERGTLKSYLQVDAHGRSIDLLRSRLASQKRERADHGHGRALRVREHEDRQHADDRDACGESVHAVEEVHGVGNANNPDYGQSTIRNAAQQG